MPCLNGSFVPGFVDGLHGHDVCFPHFFDCVVNQPAGNPVPPELLVDIHCIDDADSPGFDDGGDGFPLVHAADEESRHAFLVIIAGGDVPDARQRREIDEVLAERLIQVGLKEVGWDRADLRRRAKGDAVKVAIARRLRRETPMTRSWIAQRLHMGSTSYLSSLLAHDDS